MCKFIRCLLAVAFLAVGGPAVSDVRDLRADRWKKTTVANVGTGVVQYTGDDTKFGQFPVRIEDRLRALPEVKKSSLIEIKTIDVRLSLPDVHVDPLDIQAQQVAMPRGAALVPGIAYLFTNFSKNKSASAVFCVAVDGKNYLGNDAKLFRFGPEDELSESIERALKLLEQAIRSGNSVDSPACDPGWEGGQEN